MAMNWDTINKRCETIPFKSIALGDQYRLELYWSKNSGTYGHQVYYALVDNDGTVDTVFYKTDGCGYCKESEALGNALRHVGKAPRGMHVGSESIPYQFKVGGNYYKVLQKDMLKIRG